MLIINLKKIDRTVYHYVYLNNWLGWHFLINVITNSDLIFKFFLQNYSFLYQCTSTKIQLSKYIFLNLKLIYYKKKYKWNLSIFGVSIASELSWYGHISSVVKSAARKICFLFRSGSFSHYTRTCPISVPFPNIALI